MTTSPDQPKDTVAALIRRAQKSLNLNDEAIAKALGYENPTVVRLIKAEQMGLPLKKAAALADVLDLEPSAVMRLMLEEKAPEMLAAIEECMGPLDLSPGEKRLISTLRKSAHGREPTPIFMDGASIIAVVVG